MKPDPTQCDGAVVRVIKAQGPGQRPRVRGIGLAVGLLGMVSLAQPQAEKINAVIGEQVRAEQAAKASQKRVASLDRKRPRCWPNIAR